MFLPTNLPWRRPARAATRRAVRPGRRFGGEIHLDPVAAPVGGQQAAASVKTRLAACGQMSVLPQHVGAGHGGVAAEIHFDRRGKPAQIVAIVGGT